MNIFLATLPFAAGILLKVTVFFRSGGAQRAALDKLEAGHKKPGDPEVLSDGQRSVVLAILGVSTASITAASTLITSLVTFLIVALKYQQRWIWGCWILDLLCSAGLWFYIKTRKQPFQRVLKCKVGTFILLLSGFLDALGLVPTIVALRVTAPPGLSLQHIRSYHSGPWLAFDAQVEKPPIAMQQGSLLALEKAAYGLSGEHVAALRGHSACGCGRSGIALGHSSGS